MYKNKYLKYKNKYLNLKEQIGGLPRKICQIDQLMSDPNYKTNCDNTKVVTGSCGDPSFDKEGIVDITNKEMNEYLEIFSLIRNNRENIEYFDIILGSSVYDRSDFTRGTDISKTFQLLIDPNRNGYDSFDILKSNIIRNGISGKIYTFSSSFPLTHIPPNSRRVLDALIDLNKSVKVRITNRMCGTCHRSLYYLVQNGIEYVVNPEQGLGSLDSYAVQKCFDKKFVECIKIRERMGCYKTNDESGTIDFVYP